MLDSLFCPQSLSPNTQMRSPVAIEEGHQLSIRILERLQDLLTSHVQQVVDKIKASTQQSITATWALGPCNHCPGSSLQLSGLRASTMFLPWYPPLVCKVNGCKRGKARNIPLPSENYVYHSSSGDPADQTEILKCVKLSTCEPVGKLQIIYMTNALRIQSWLPSMMDAEAP